MLGTGCLGGRDQRAGTESPTATRALTNSLETQTEKTETATSTPDTTSETPTPTEYTPTETDYDCAPRSVSVVDAVSPTEAISIEATLQQDTITDDHTGHLIVQFTNQDDSSREIPFATESPGPWRSDESDLYLLPSSSDQQQTPGGCWIAGSENNLITGSGGAEYTTVPPNTTVESEYELWDYAREEGYLEPGVYRFESNGYGIKLEIQK